MPNAAPPLPAFSHLFAAEALLALRRCTRGAFCWTLPPLLALLLLALPGARDPGLLRTPYALGLCWALLLVCALWSGAMVYAHDRARALLDLPLSKPLRRGSLWCARFLGSLLPFGAACLLIWALVAWRPLPEGRQRLAPELPRIEQVAQTEFERFRAEGKLPQGVPQWRLMAAFREAVAARYTELVPGQPRTYRFKIPASARAGAGAFRLSGAPFLGAKESLQLAVTAHCAGQRQQRVPEVLRDHGFTLDLGADFLQPGAEATLTLDRRDAGEAASVLYREYGEVALLLPGLSPRVNLACCCVAIFATVAMALALGMTLGSLFSVPVALFTGALALLACTCATLSPSTTVADEQASRFGRLSAPVSRLIAAPFAPLVSLSPLVRLFDGLAITPRELIAFALRSLLPWLVLCALGGALRASEEPPAS